MDDAGIVNAAAHVQHRRNPQGAAEAGEAGPGLGRGFRHQEPGLAHGRGGAAGHQDQDVAADKFPGQGDVAVILLQLGVVATDHPHRAAQGSGLQGLDQGGRSAAQGAQDGLVGKAAHDLDGFHRNVHPGRVAFLEGFNGQAHHLAGQVPGVFRGEVEGFGAGEVGLVRSGDEPGVETLGQIDQAGHDALVVGHYGFHRPGHDGQFGHHVVAGYGDALAHQKLVPGAAEPGHVEAGGAGLPGRLDQLGINRGGQDHFRDQGVVAVDQDVDLVFFDDPQVDPALVRGRGAEDDVGNLGAGHGAAPAVGQGGAGGVEAEGDRVAIHAHVGTVKHLHGFAVNAARGDVQLVPQGFAGRRQALEKGEARPEAGEILAQALGQGLGHGQGLALGVQADLGRQAAQLGLVPDSVARGAAAADVIKHFHQVPAVVGMGGRPAGHEAAEIAGHSQIGPGPADALVPVQPGYQAAGPHDALGAGKALVADVALGGLLFQAVPGQGEAPGAGLVNQGAGFLRPHGAFGRCLVKFRIFYFRHLLLLPSTI